MPLRLLLGASLFLLLTVAAAAVSQAWGPVSRRRVIAFARKHDLRISTDNGEQVIRYLAVTRRWRAAGVIGATTAYLAAVVPAGQIGINLLTVLSGWFLGAVAAEIRLVPRRSGPRRTASLQPRTSGRYIGRLLGALPLVALLGSSAVWIRAVAVYGWSAAVSWHHLTGFVASGLVVGVVEWTRRRVLRRPRSAMSASRMAADDAIRSRSLHTLCASAATLAAYAVLGQITAQNAVGSTGSGAAPTLAAVVVPVAGWLLANARWSVEQPAEAVPSEPAVSR